MSLISYKEWLDKESSGGGGEIWDNHSNADLNFGRTGARAKNNSQDKISQANGLDPEKLFFGFSKKRIEKLDNKNPINGDKNDNNNIPSQS